MRGILAFGFARARCIDCQQERLVAFSCKGRCVVRPARIGAWPRSRRTSATASYRPGRVVATVGIGHGSWGGVARRVRCNRTWGQRRELHRVGGGYSREVLQRRPGPRSETQLGRFCNRSATSRATGFAFHDPRAGIPTRPVRSSRSMAAGGSTASGPRPLSSGSVANSRLAAEDRRRGIPRCALALGAARSCLVVQPPPGRPRASGPPFAERCAAQPSASAWDRSTGV